MIVLTAGQYSNSDGEKQMKLLRIICSTEAKKLHSEIIHVVFCSLPFRCRSLSELATCVLKHLYS